MGIRNVKKYITFGLIMHAPTQHLKRFNNSSKDNGHT